MKKIIERISLLSIVAVLTMGIVSCGDDDDEVTVNQSQVFFGGEGGSQTILVNSNTNWSVTGMMNGLSVSPSAGSGNGTFVITAEANTSTNTKNWTLVVNAGDAQAIVNVSQSARNLDLADRVVGTYVGQLKSNDVLLEDAHPIVVTKLSATAVSAHSSVIFNGTANFNLEESNNQIVFKNSTFADYQMFVMGNTMNITYQTSGGYMLVYTGQK